LGKYHRFYSGRIDQICLQMSGNCSAATIANNQRFFCMIAQRQNPGNGQIAPFIQGQDISTLICNLQIL